MPIAAIPKGLLCGFHKNPFISLCLCPVSQEINILTGEITSQQNILNQYFSIGCATD